MSERWKMNRIGLVNFWLYDEEEFFFEDGRLLLRGQNGSGKSITTQSFIPFILDGDRTPSRLDPFGSSDRRMEYYFLGEEGKEESTGYLFLEFRREGEEAYRTIGIGQRARRGSAMEFWGFLILDGRRIGRDLWLYRKSGSVKIPLDRRDMKKEIGAGGLFTESPKEYRQMVNRNLFGFRKEEQYEQFVRLLVKVRAPKLSKELRPTKVYEILNDSLQTLTDEDLRPMVDAMEKMDEIQESLATLKRAYEDVRIIRTEYTRYNQYMLAKKAGAYLEARAEAEKAQLELTEREAELIRLEDSQRSRQERLDCLEEEQRLARTEREGLLDEDLTGMEERLSRASQEKQAAEESAGKWKKRAEDYNGAVFQGEQKLRKLMAEVEAGEQALREQVQELVLLQETLKWQRHEEAVDRLRAERPDTVPALLRELEEYRKQVAAGLRIIREHREAERRLTEAEAALSLLHQESAENDAARETSEHALQEEKDTWIEAMFSLAKDAKEWKIPQELLLEAETAVLSLYSSAEGAAVREKLRSSYEERHLRLLGEKAALLRQREETEGKKKDAEEALQKIRAAKEVEPPRTEEVLRSRAALESAGIQAVPFYQAVEFSEELSGAERGTIEAALRSTGLLDALVVTPGDAARIEKQCPEFLDTLILVEGEGGSAFSGLYVSEAQPHPIQQETARILRHIRMLLPANAAEGSVGHEKEVGFGEAAGTGAVSGKKAETEPKAETETGAAVPAAEAGIETRTATGTRSGTKTETGTEPEVVLGTDGVFRHGILAGRAGASGDAEMVGALARARRREQRIAELTAEVQALEAELRRLNTEISGMEERILTLAREFDSLPEFRKMEEILTQLHLLARDRERLSRQEKAQEERTSAFREQRDEIYQRLLRSCRSLPYGRTTEEYEEASEAISDYVRILQLYQKDLGSLTVSRENRAVQEDRIEQDRESLESALSEERSAGIRARECELRIRQAEEYLNRPEIAEKTRRLRELAEVLRRVDEEARRVSAAFYQEQGQLNIRRQELPGVRARMERCSAAETLLQAYFEEELNLKLVLDPGAERGTPAEMAERARKELRESDRNREPSEMLHALFSVLQKHSGSLVHYGTQTEECFAGDPAELLEVPAVRPEEQKAAAFPGAQTAGVLRSRQRIVSVWNGKRVYLEEFYGILKASMEETELLIRQKDRELFEDILSRTISQQLTDRIAESRKWVEDMSELMRSMDTSMGLRFSLDWKPEKAENEDELDVSELEQILLRDRSLITAEDIGRVASHFRSRIREEKLKLEQNDAVVNYMELVRDALDYRKWFRFQMYCRRGSDQRKPLTNAAFNRFSGGEKAMAMYVPLFAAVSAQYQKAEQAGHPRMIALDEAFAGVDDRNISSMFELIDRLDFDYIMNSQVLWGCYETVKGLRIAELMKPDNADVVTVIRYTWNGRERILDEQ